MGCYVLRGASIISLLAESAPALLHICAEAQRFRVQVVVYQYTKLQQMKAKAALSTTKDVEKMDGAGGGA